MQKLQRAKNKTDVFFWSQIFIMCNIMHPLQTRAHRDHVNVKFMLRNLYIRIRE
jgi:hypothetical protein